MQIFCTLSTCSRGSSAGCHLQHQHPRGSQAGSNAQTAPPRLSPPALEPTNPVNIHDHKTIAWLHLHKGPRPHLLACWHQGAPKPLPAAQTLPLSQLRRGCGASRSFIGAAGPKIGSSGTDFLAGKETSVSLDVSNIFRRSATLPSRSLLEGGRKARERLEVCCLTQLTNYFQVKRGQSYKRCLLL